jgi:hypothetical protein
MILCGMLGIIVSKENTISIFRIEVSVVGKLATYIEVGGNRWTTWVEVTNQRHSSEFFFVLRVKLFKLYQSNEYQYTSSWLGCSVKYAETWTSYKSQHFEGGSFVDFF